MKIGIVTIAYNQAEFTRQLFESAVSQAHEVDYRLFLHSQYEDVVEVCETLSERPEVLYYPYGENRGLSKSWNEGMLHAYTSACDVVIIVNDDIRFAEGDLDRLAEYAHQHPEFYAVHCQGWQERLGKMGSIGWSCFAINPLALKRVGCFDENIFPIYFEDCDYSRRAKLLGLKSGYCDSTSLRHEGSASIIHSNPYLIAQHHATFEANKQYYIRKWGGENDHEVHLHPFGNEEIGLYISPRECAKPYGKAYDRTDQGIVQI